MVCLCSVVVDVGGLSYWLTLTSFPNQNTNQTAACFSSPSITYVLKKRDQSKILQMISEQDS